MRNPQRHEVDPSEAEKIRLILGAAPQEGDALVLPRSAQTENLRPWAIRPAPRVSRRRIPEVEARGLSS